MSKAFHLGVNRHSPCGARPGNCPLDGDHFDMWSDDTVLNDEIRRSFVRRMIRQEPL